MNVPCEDCSTARIDDERVFSAMVLSSMNFDYGSSSKALHTLLNDRCICFFSIYRS